MKEKVEIRKTEIEIEESQMLAKLPKWAQAHIKELKREREMAIRTLNEFTDEQKPSNIYVDEYVCTGEKSGPSSKRRYVQSSKIAIESNNVLLDIYIRDGIIECSYGTSNRTVGEIALIPASFQKFTLKTKQDMRG